MTTVFGPMCTGAFSSCCRDRDITATPQESPYAGFKSSHSPALPPAQRSSTMSQDFRHAGVNMADSSAETQLNGLREIVNEDAAQLIRHLRCSHAPEDALTAATGHIQRGDRRAQAVAQGGGGWSTISIAGDHAGLPGRRTISRR
ncbi:MAG: hypothetical protein R3E54_06290 [Halioglobus sp.]